MEPVDTAVFPWLLAAVLAVILIIQTLGLLSALHALMNVRTSQGTVAWCIALVSFPLISLPLYWIFGRNRFHGYVQTLRAAIAENAELAEEIREALQPHHGSFQQDEFPCEFALDRLTTRQFTRGNRIDLLIDGTETFDAICRDIEQAKDYILVQFFIVKNDDLGRRIKELLIRKACEGVRTFFLYDEVGSHRLVRSYFADLEAAGAQVRGFGTTRGRVNPFSINFRNHRKIVIVDGRTCFVGGHNIGDEYLGKKPKFGRWRDTHVRMEGPVVQGVQASFLEDWFWGGRYVPDLNWQPQRIEGHDVQILPLETGPTSRIEACTLMFHQIIASSRERLWIASPYFVPDEGVADALKLAAIRGVDVRILIPDKPDHKMVYLAAFSYLAEMEDAGVKIFRFEDGFLHQKVALVDRRLAVVGTANLDNRSFRLNFELSIVISDPEFQKQVETMLEDDFALARQIDSRDYTEAHLGFKFAVRFARLLAPML